MRNFTKQYIDGEWVESASGETLDVINPATEEVAGTIAKGNKEDVNNESLYTLETTALGSKCENSDLSYGFIEWFVPDLSSHLCKAYIFLINLDNKKKQTIKAMLPTKNKAY